MLDCVIVGGGIAGLQAAIQLGRNKHDVLVIDSGYGRSTLCRSYHNVLGWPKGISGAELRRLGREHAEGAGAAFASDTLTGAERISQPDGGFRLHGASGRVYEARTVLLATGVVDRFPDLPGLVPCLGVSVYVCPDCDAYEVLGKKTAVLGSGETGAKIALTLLGTAAELVYINHEKQPVQSGTMERLTQAKIGYREKGIRQLELAGDGLLAAVELEDGEKVTAEKGFIAFGGNAVKSELAEQLGVERHENRHIPTDARSKMTNVPGVWAAGDVGLHSEQLAIAMGEGMQAAIWIHKKLVSSANSHIPVSAT